MIDQSCNPVIECVMGLKVSRMKRFPPEPDLVIRDCENLLVA